MIMNTSETTTAPLQAKENFVELHYESILSFLAPDSKKEATAIREASVFVYNMTIKKMEDIKPVLDKIEHSRWPVLIIADGIEGDPMSSLFVKKQQGFSNVFAIRIISNEHKLSLLELVAKNTGTVVISGNQNLEPEDKLIEPGSIKQARFEKNVLQLEGNPKTILPAGGQEKASYIIDHKKIIQAGQSLKSLAYTIMVSILFSVFMVFIVSSNQGNSDFEPTFVMGVIMIILFVFFIIKLLDAGKSLESSIIKEDPEESAKEQPTV